MVDSLLFAKLSTKMELYVDMARLENESRDEIVCNVKNEKDLNTLKASDDLPMASKKATMSKFKILLSSGLTAYIYCNCCAGKCRLP